MKKYFLGPEYKNDSTIKLPNKYSGINASSNVSSDILEYQKNKKGLNILF